MEKKNSYFRSKLFTMRSIWPAIVVVLFIGVFYWEFTNYQSIENLKSQMYHQQSLLRHSVYPINKAIKFHVAPVNKTLDEQELTVVVTLIAVGFALFSFITYQGVAGILISEGHKHKKQYRKYKHAYEENLRIIHNLEGDFLYEVAKNINLTLETEKLLSKSKKIQLLVKQAANYSRYLTLKKDLSQGRVNETKDLIRGSLESAENLANEETIDVKEMGYSEFNKLAEEIRFQGDQQIHRLLNRILACIRFDGNSFEDFKRKKSSFKITL